MSDENEKNNPAVPVVDLAEGKLPEHEKQRLALQQSQLKQQITQQQVAFYMSLGFAVVMTLAFLFFSYRLVCFAATDHIFDWHLLLLGSGLIIPPTIVMFALIRRLYPLPTTASPKDDEDEKIPAKGVLSEVTKLLKEFREVAGLGGKSEGSAGE